MGKGILVGLSMMCLSVVALVGCAGALSPGEDVAGSAANAVKFVHDATRGVGCWYVVGTDGGGSISCLPDSQYVLP